MNDPFAHCLDYLCKLAEEPPAAAPAPSPYRRLPGIIAGSALGLTAGYGAGALIGQGLERLGGKAGVPAGNIARVVSPIAGTVGGVLYPLWKQREQELIRGAHDGGTGTREQSASGPPRQ